MKLPAQLLLVATVRIASPSGAFQICTSNNWRRASIATNHHEIIFSSSSQAANNRSPSLQMARYGPRDVDVNQPSSSDGDSTQSEDAMREKMKSEFATLLDSMIAADNREELPSLLTKNIESILTIMGTDGLIEEVIQDDVQKYNANEDRLDQISAAVSMIVTFVESFVEQAASMDDVYKNLLGKIFQSIAPGDSQANKNENINLGGPNMEANLDELLASEKDAFTPGFLRHVDGECSRIAALPKISPESAKMLQILRLIQTRILEELGKNIGEGAIVLGQLLGYDDKGERLAVLDAGLAVRGVEFAHELAALTEEALDGFNSVSGGVDPGLIKSVKEIDDRIRLFIEKQSDFQ